MNQNTPLLLPQSKISNPEISNSEISNPEISNPEISNPEISNPPRPISPRRLAANRANALKSTGPRTPAGKARSSLNALKSTGPKTPAGKARSSQNALVHGLRATHVSPFTPILPEDCPAAFQLFKHELEAALQPHNTMQRFYFTGILNLAWRLHRLAEAQIKLFEYEQERANPQKPPANAAELLARRFSDDPQNGFLLLNRYEQSIRNNFHRLIKLLHNAAGPDNYHPHDL